MANRVIASLDIGSNNVVCCIGEINEADNSNSSIILKSAWLKESKGVKNGEITNIKDFIQIIIKTITHAEEIYRKNIKDIVINFSDINVQSLIVSLEKETNSKGVTYDDIAYVSQKISKKLNQEEKEILHLILLSITTENNFSNINKNKSKFSFHVCSYEKSKLELLKNTLKKINLNINNIVSSVYASSLAILNDTQKKNGVLVLDIGSDLTKFCIFSNGKFIFQETIPLAGKIITEDIATILKIPSSLAEKIKISNVNMMLDLIEENDVININLEELGDDYKIASTKKKLVNDIFKARIREVTELVLDILKNKKINNNFNQVILTGGTSNVFGLENFISDTFKIDTKKGVLNKNLIFDSNLRKDIIINNYSYYTAIGLLFFELYSINQEKILNIKQKTSSIQNFVNNFIKSLVNLFIS